MNTIKVICLFFSLTGSLVNSLVAPRTTQAQHHRPENPAHRINGEFGVVLREGYTLEEHFAFIGIDLSQKASIFHRIEIVNGYRAKLDSHILHNLIRYDPGVLSVQDDTIVEPMLEVSSGEEFQIQNKKRYIQGQREGCKWWLTMIQGGKKVAPNPEKQTCSTIFDGGKGVHVYVLDTGVRISHARFGVPGGPVATHFKNLQNNLYVEESSDDVKGHGTHVAGIISDFAFGVHIVSVKVVGKGGSVAIIAHAINDVVKEHNDYKKTRLPGFRGSVINMSLGGPENKLFRAAVKAARDAGIPIAVSAGNDNKLSFKSPAIYDESVMAISSVDRNYTKSTFSNFGPHVKISAPGTGIEALGIKSDNSYAVKSGTNMAAPFVAGVMALVVGFEGITSDVDKVYSRIVANGIENAIEGFPADSPGGDNNTVNRLLDIGWNNPNKGRNTPYKDGPRLTDDEIKHANTTRNFDETEKTIDSAIEAIASNNIIAR